MSLWNRILQKLIGANQPKIEQPLAGKLAVSPRLENNLAYITELFADVADFVCRRLSVGGRPAALLYLRGITDARVIQEGIAGPLLQCQHNASLSELLQCISVSNFACSQDLHQALLQMLEGGFCSCVKVCPKLFWSMQRIFQSVISPSPNRCCYSGHRKALLNIWKTTLLCAFTHAC